MEATFEKVKELLQKVLEDDSKVIEMETYLIDDLDMSSLEIATFSVDLETEFGCGVPDSEMAKFVQVKDIVEYISSVI